MIRDDSGALFIDGEPVVRTFMPATTPSRYATKVAQRRSAATAIDEVELDED